MTNVVKNVTHIPLARAFYLLHLALYLGTRHQMDILARQATCAVVTLNARNSCTAYVYMAARVDLLSSPLSATCSCASLSFFLLQIWPWSSSPSFSSLPVSSFSKRYRLMGQASLLQCLQPFLSVLSSVCFASASDYGKQCQEVTLGPLYIGQQKAQAVDQPIPLDGAFTGAGSTAHAGFLMSVQDVTFRLTWGAADRKLTLENSRNLDKNKYVYKISTDDHVAPGPVISDTVKWFYLFDDDICQTVYDVEPRRVVVQRIEPM